jgi:probable HAF family extracellular repeat protein
LTDDLGTFGGSNSIARSINENGWSVGSAQIAGNAAWRAFLLPPEETLDVNRDHLGTLGGDSHAIDLSIHLVVVGVSRLADNTRHAFVYDGTSLYDLNDLIPSDSGWVLNEASAINDDGLIVGTGTLGGQTRGFLLVPGTPIFIPADLDDDGDVDIDDFGVFQSCGSGPTVPASVECAPADFDDDGDVDQSDFGYYQECYSGPDLPVIEPCIETVE